MGLGRCPSPKCAIHPLTRLAHPCYYPHRSNTILTISRRNQKLGKPTRPTRGLNAQAHPNGRTAAHGSSKRRHLLFPPGPVPLSLVVRRWKDALDRAIVDRPSPAETPFRRSVSSELTLYQARGGGPAIPGRDSLSEVGPPASLRHIKQGAVGPLGPSGGPRK